MLKVYKIMDPKRRDNYENEQARFTSLIDG